MSDEVRQWVTLAEIDEQRAKGWVDFHPEDYCHRCGGRNVYSWHAPNDVWNRVVGDRWNGIVCPQCFTELAREARVEPSVWLLRDGDAEPTDQRETRTEWGVRTWPGKPYEQTYNIGDRQWAEDEAVRHRASGGVVVRREVGPWVEVPS